jgi:hypothetical protein
MTRFHAVWLCIVLTGLVAMPLVGCGMMRDRGATQFSMQPGDPTPAATGSIAVSEADHQNQRLKINVAHLPPPEQLHPSLSTFVVWGSQPGEGQQSAMNLGQIRIDQNRQGTIEVITPYPDLDIRVTAESESTPDRPSDFVVLEGNVMTGALR